MNQKACIGCGICTFGCSTKAIALINSCATIDYSLCIHCGTCANSCPVGAIKEHTTALAR
ncbi:MAG: 4Fe-4S binding protein [Erysipelotrichaceae bacterium]|nr:4Fe-4S binding protein [Erysipelotrichaceae bacterium]